MPVIDSKYHPPFWFRNGHVNSIYPSIFRSISGLEYRRERLHTPDDDFLDLDWSRVGSDRLILILHGLEGNAARPYVKGMIKFFNKNGWDGAGLNFRGCSGEINRQLRMYHSGEIEDLAFVLDHIGSHYLYREVVLVGFSLGGSVVLNYVSRKGSAVHPLLKKAMAVSTPVDLVNSARLLDGGGFNTIYLRRFLSKLREKAIVKAQRFPGQFDLELVSQYKTFFEFDENVTARIHGFDNALHYYTEASSKSHLRGIAIPTLLLNASDDSFLGAGSYPFELAHSNPKLYLEVPQYGGHVGFVDFRANGYYYSERRALQFMEE